MDARAATPTIRVVAAYSEPIDVNRFEQHVRLCREVPGGTFSHGPVLRTLHGQELTHAAVWEFPDDETFRAASQSAEFKAAAADSAEMGVAHSVYVIQLG